MTRSQRYGQQVVHRILGVIVAAALMVGFALLVAALPN